MAFVTDARLWRFPPNWSNAFDLEYEYKTDILISRSGKEQRHSLRQSPRKSASFSSMIHTKTLQDFVREMSAAQDAKFIFPEYTRWKLTSNQLNIGANTITLPVVPEWVFIGAVVVIRKQATLDFFEVANVIDNDVEFTTTATSIWPVGSLVHPGIYGFLTNDIAAKIATDRVGTVEVRFDFDPGAEPIPLPPSTPVVFNGRELFMQKPNWADALVLGFSNGTETLDYGYGRMARRNPVAFQTRQQKASYVGKTNAESFQLIDFFDRMQGRRDEFYMPTWEDDLTPLGGLLTGVASITVEGEQAAVDYLNDTVNKAIVVFLDDGSYLLRKVLTNGIAVLSGNTVIPIDTAWGDTIPSSRIKRVSWLPVWRFGSDKLTVQWLTNTVSQFALTFQTLEDLTGD
jgi:hypothetical protein